MLLRGAARYSAAAIACVVVLAGCSSPGEGPSAHSSTAAQTSVPGSQPEDSFSWLSSVLPTDPELSEALGYPVTTDGPPRVRTDVKFRNTFVGSGDIAARECIGVVSALEQEAYRSVPAVAVSFATEAAATYSVVAFDSVDSAVTVFQTFSKKWKACDGRTVEKSGGGAVMRYSITDVRSTQNVVSALNTVTSNEGSPIITGRALGVAQDCIVEVELVYDDPTSRSLAEDRAIVLVEAMLSRVRTL